MTLDAVFFALSDETRRGVVERLLAAESITATELARGLPISRQAVTKHLTALSEAGLLRSRREGRETRYALSPEPLGDASAWLESIGREWDDRLSALRRHMETGD